MITLFLFMCYLMPICSCFLISVLLAEIYAPFEPFSTDALSWADNGLAMFQKSPLYLSLVPLHFLKLE